MMNEYERNINAVKKFRILLIISFLILISFSLYSLYKSQIEKEQIKYQEIAIKTCEYANNLTDMVNRQSGILEKYMNKPENDLTRINKLNCSLLE